LELVDVTAVVGVLEAAETLLLLFGEEEEGGGKGGDLEG